MEKINEVCFMKRGDLSDKYLFCGLEKTLIEPKKGKIIKNWSNWKLKYNEVLTLSKIDIPLVIFSNVKTIDYENILLLFSYLQLKRKPWIFLCTCLELEKYKQPEKIREFFLFRVPNTKMFTIFCSLSNYKINKNTFFLGGNIGRKLTDKNSEDKHFADNLHIKCITPEEYFLGKNVKFPYECFNPLLLEKDEMVVPFIPNNIKLLLLQGPRGSGKTYYSKKYFKDWIRVCKDEIGEVECEKIAKKVLREGGRVLVDKIHPGHTSWNYFIYIARECNVKFGIITIRIPKIISNHLNYFKFIEENKHFFNSNSFGLYCKKYEKPTTTVGFSFMKEIFWKSETNKIGQWYF